ncbi:hypothetical protein BCY86_03785 [Pajaroellobacter abortibovis]|uniref:Response regulatory domain-containing protein n=1 Tax=Pajaroellobacter abortibovis TaxID=1882918 RepID=A0A1L6MWI7_9BACT|nr:hypothetical protein BCY86_03785 [Pajaroellobacter abortibovis]
MLIIDDNTIIRKTFEMTFGPEGFQVSTAASCSAAASLLETHPRILFIDIHLADQERYAFCKQIRRQDRYVGIILLTSQFHPFDEEKGKLAGADDHLVKPFEAHHALEKVHHLLVVKDLARLTHPAPLAHASPPAVPSPPPTALRVFNASSAESHHPPNLKSPLPRATYPSPLAVLSPPSISCFALSSASPSSLTPSSKKEEHILPSKVSSSILSDPVSRISPPLPIITSRVPTAPTEEHPLSSAPLPPPSVLVTPSSIPVTPPPPSTRLPSLSNQASIPPPLPSLQSIPPLPPSSPPPPSLHSSKVSKIIQDEILYKIEGLPLTPKQIEGFLILSQQAIEKAIKEIIPSLVKELIQQELDVLIREK